MFNYCFVFVVLYIHTITAEKPIACVTGQLRCAADPNQANNVNVQMYSATHSDMGSTKSDANGHYEFCGVVSNNDGDRSARPYIRVQHHCKIAPYCFGVIKKDLQAIGSRFFKKQEINFNLEESDAVACA